MRVKRSPGHEWLSAMHPIALALGVSLVSVADGASESPFWQRVMEILGISATPHAVKASGEGLRGRIFVVSRADETLSKLTDDGGYSSPVFSPDGKSILALKGNRVVEITIAGGGVKVRHTGDGIVKLVGFDHQNPDKLLILLESKDRPLSVGLLSPASGEVETIPYDRGSAKDRLGVSYLGGWDSEHDGIKVYVKEHTKDGLAGEEKWTDVHLKEGSKADVNLCNGDGVSCGHPSLSRDGQRVVFVRAAD